MRNIQQALEAVAQAHGICVEEVVVEIENAIAAASQENQQDPHIQAMWKAIPSAGLRPTAEEFLRYILTAMEQDSVFP